MIRAARICRLDGSRLDSLERVYAELANQLGFPDWFHPNLDALWDVLTLEMAGPIEIVWTNWACARTLIGADLEQVQAVLKAVAQERDDVALHID